MKPSLKLFTQEEKFYHSFVLKKINKKTNENTLVDLSTKYKIVYLDPAVMELKTDIEFSQIEKLEYLATIKLSKNVAMSIDYPCDMNPTYNDLFLEKTWKNIDRFCKNPNYILTLQHYFLDYESFVENFHRLLPYIQKYNRIIGIGNMCRLLKKNEVEFGKKCINYMNKYLRNKRIHIYGLGMKLLRSSEMIELCKNNDVSIDTTKWTKAITKELKLQYGINCKLENREIFWNTYIKELSKIYEVEY